MSPDHEAKLDESIHKFGVFKPIVVRELPSGEREIIGGEHRWLSAKRIGLTEVPIVNLGKISDRRAKEISLVDNNRYGEDDPLKLNDLLLDLGSPEELAMFMPMSEEDLTSLFSNSSIALDDLDLTAEELAASTPPAAEKTLQTHRVMKFKVPVEDADWVEDLITQTMKAQRFTEDDSLTNAGDALVHLLKEFK